MSNVSTDKRMKQFDREYAIFPMEHINATQYAMAGTHVGQLAIDFAGKDTGIDGFYAPFKSKILKTYNAATGNAIILGSCDDNGNQKAIRCADGKDRVLSIFLVHSNTPQSWYENHRKRGTIFKQGDRVYGEGTAGYAFGNHVHMEVATGWHYNIHLTGQGKYYGLKNPIRQDHVFHFLNGFNRYVNNRTAKDFPLPKINVNGWNNKPKTNIESSGTFTFKLDHPVKVRNGKSGLRGSDTGKVYKNGMSVNYDSTYVKDGYTWVSYISNSGKRRSVAVGKGNTLWGSSKGVSKPKPKPKPNYKGYVVGDLIEFSVMHQSHHQDPIVYNAPKNSKGRYYGYVIHLYPKDKYPLAVSATKGGKQMGGVKPVNVYRKNNKDILK